MNAELAIIYDIRLPDIKFNDFISLPLLQFCKKLLMSHIEMISFLNIPFPLRLEYEMKEVLIVFYFQLTREVLCRHTIKLTNKCN